MTISIAIINGDGAESAPADGVVGKELRGSLLPSMR